MRNDRLDNYVPVAERIEQFYSRFNEGRILTTIIEHDRESGFVLVRAEVYRNADDAQPTATGHAYEYKDVGYVQKTSYIEVAETSAVGRALAFLNFETKRGIASREEMEKAARMTQREAPRDAPPPPPPPAPPPATAPPPREEASETATDQQKEEMLALLEALRPGDRRAQRKLLTDLTGKKSRDDLTRQEAQRFIAQLKRGDV